MSSLGIPTNLSSRAAVVPAVTDKAIESAKPLKVLVIEDCGMTRAYLTEELQRKNYSVCEAWDAEEAVETLSVKQFDLVITDGFFGLDGALEEVLDAFKISNSKNARLVIYSGNSDLEEDHSESLRKDGIQYKIISKASMGSQRLVEYITNEENWEIQASITNRITAAISVSPVDSSPLETKKPTVLIIDDQEAIRDCFSTGFELNGNFNVLTAADVDSAKEILKSQKVDYVITDGFHDGRGGDLNDLVEAFSASNNRAADFFIYTGVLESEVSTDFFDSKGINYEVVSKLKCIPNKLVNQIEERRQAVETASVSTTLSPQIIFHTIHTEADLITHALNADLGKNKKILVVDDCSETTKIINDILRSSFTVENGNEVLVAHSAEEAKAIAERENIDLLVTDLFMEPIDGVRRSNLTNGDELLRALEKCPAVVVCSGSWANDIYTPLSKHLDDVRAVIDLETVLVDSAEESRVHSKKVPILGASKFSCLQDGNSLVRLSLSALAMAKESDPHETAGFLKTFKPSLKERGKITNVCVARIQEAFSIAEASFLRFQTHLEQEDLSSLNDDRLNKQIGNLKSSTEAFQVVREKVRDLYQADEKNRSQMFHDISNKILPIQSNLYFLSEFLLQKNKPELANEASECQRLLWDFANDELKRNKTRLEDLVKPQRFPLMVEVEKMITSDFPEHIANIKIDPSNFWAFGIKPDYVDMIKQLVMNSIKATRNTDSPLIRVSISEQPDPKSILIEVSDNGCGIPGDRLAVINTGGLLKSSFGTGGEGLGFVYEKLSKLKATLLASSAGENQGSVFKISIPVKE